MVVRKLRTNHLTEPIGIGRDGIELSWLPDCAASQSAYRVKIISGEKTLLDTGRVVSSATSFLPVMRFDTRTRYEWSVTLWDECGNPSDEVRSFFETGIEKSEISAKWIDPEFHGKAEIIRDGRIYHRASYLEKRFTLGTTADARLYITAHGIYDAYINGAHVDGYLLAPGSSQYNKRLQVQTYDVTSLLHEGENDITVTLGDGWWRGSTGYTQAQNVFGDDVALLCQLEIGGKTALVSDETWTASQDGPLGFNDPMRGEEYDARRKISARHPAAVRDYPLDNLIPSALPVTAHERFTPVLITTPKGEKVLDFGQNFAGYVEFDITADGGEKIVLLHGETLAPDGCFTQENYQNSELPLCDQKIVYICKNGRNIYHQTKCYFGFRYVKIESEIPVGGSEFTGVAIYSDMEQTGFFRCGNADVNRLFDNTLWSMKSNYVDVPTDCPTREKSGFSGDCQVFAGTAVYLMDCCSVLSRWLREQCSTQRDDGNVKEIAPCTPEFDAMDGCAGWCDSMEIVPLQLMNFYNSKRIITELYPYIRKWMEFCINRAHEYRPENENMPREIRDWFVDNGVHWGEWCEPGRGPLDYVNELRATGCAEEATAYLSYGCRTVADFAELLGRNDDCKFFNHAAECARNAYRHVYVNNGRISSDRQCRYVRPLAFGLLDGDEKEQAAADLVSLIRANGNRIGTGFLTTNSILGVLTDNGYASTAYDMLLTTECPSWLNEVKKGATTVWESWNGIGSDGSASGSLNHYSFGSVSGWLMTRVGGISLSRGEITVRPYPDERLGFAETALDSPLGRIESEWRYTADRIVFRVRIPCNAKARIILPDGEEYAVCAGEYEYAIRK